MKFWEVDFEPLWPVGSCLIIAAESYEQAEEIAKKTLTHTGINTITEIDVSKPCVIKYLNGDY